MTVRAAAATVAAVAIAAVGCAPAHAESSIQLLAKADLADGVGADAVVYVNGSRVGDVMVGATSYTTYTIPLSSALANGDRVDVFFANDTVSNGQDRNLYVKSVTSGSSTVTVNSTTTSYDVGYSYAVATDGQEMRSTQPTMPWSGALRIASWQTNNATPSLAAGSTPAVGARALSGLTDHQGIIMAQTGQTISGLRITNGSGTCIYVARGVHDVTITGNEIGTCGTTVKDVGIELQPDSYNITITNNVIHGVASGLFATWAHNPIIFSHNTVYDVRGPSPRGQMVQFDEVSGGSGQSQISANISDKDAATGPTAYEDHISLHASSGSSGNPILVSCNKIRGGDSASGSGILAGDDGGSWITVRNNIVVRTPNTGIGVPGGSNEVIDSNLIANDGTSASSLTEGVMYVMKWGNTVPSNISISNNHGISRAWISGNKSGAYHYGLWDDKTGVNISYDNNNFQDMSLNGDSLWNQTPSGC